MILSDENWSEVKWSESHSLVSNSLWPHGPYSPWNSPGQNTWVGRLSLLQGIFPTQGSNLGLLHCRQILYQLCHKESPNCEEVSSNLSSDSKTYSLVLISLFISGSLAVTIYWASSQGQTLYQILHKWDKHTLSCLVLTTAQYAFILKLGEFFLKIISLLAVLGLHGYVGFSLQWLLLLKEKLWQT